MGSFRRPFDPERRARALLVECLLAVAEERPRLTALAAGPTPWARVVDLARAAMVEETAAYVLLAGGGLVGGPAREALEDAYQNGTAKNALLLRDAAEIQLALRGAGVESVALKGVALVAAHYPALGARHVGDLDLLVRRADLGGAREVLARLGMRQPISDGAAVGSRHHLSPYVTPGGLSCEVHHRLPGAADGDVEGVISRSREISWQGRTLRIPSAADLVGIASAHALTHHRGDGRFRARLVADLAVLATSRTDLQAARRLHGRAVDVALHLLDDARAGRPEAALPLLLGGPVGDVIRRAATLGVTVARAARHGQIAAVFFPNRAALSRRYGVRSTAPLLPLLYLYRPFGALLRVFTGR